MLRIIRLEQSPQFPHSPFSLYADVIEKRISFNYEPKATDIILFGGGTDVNPGYYGEKLHRKSQQPDYYRDQEESEIFHKCKDKVAGFIGICRGAQFLTVLNGGKLIQDTIGHYGNSYIHPIVTDDGRKLNVTSTHHQMMYPFNMDKNDYHIIAHAPQKRSLYYKNGEDKDIGETVPCDPEIVWYPKTNSLCIQGHPEYVGKTHEFFIYTQELFQKYFLSKLLSK